MRGGVRGLAYLTITGLRGKKTQGSEWEGIWDHKQLPACGYSLYLAYMLLHVDEHDQN